MNAKQLTLVKGSERFIFRYAQGAEAAVLDCLIDMASDAQCVLDWFDAAVLSYQIGRTLGEAKCPTPAAGPRHPHRTWEPEA
jgi:hypothetical protein